MNAPIRFSLVLIVAGLTAPLAVSRAQAGGVDDSSPRKDRPSASAGDKAGPGSGQVKDETPTVNLLDAMRKGSVSVQAEGRSGGRITVSLTNRTRKPLRVVLPPGIIAQSATGQMGGMMGGMGGMGGRGGGMGGGMGGGRMGGGMGRRGGGTMPPMMGMMMLARLIRLVCGAYEGWDRGRL